MKDMNKMFSALKGFTLVDGLEIKAHKTFKGHARETLSQGNIYFEGKKIGFIAEDKWNGETRIDIDENKKAEFATLESRIKEKGFTYTFPDGAKHELTTTNYLTEVIIMTRIYLMTTKSLKTRTQVYNKNGRYTYSISAPYTDEHKAGIDEMLEDGDIVLNELV